ncbi:MAG: hypothetical protein U5L74_01010 [Ideonella sp.]|nr:hypothetical protein [Ideonella sp.]
MYAFDVQGIPPQTHVLLKDLLVHVTGINPKNPKMMLKVFRHVPLAEARLAARILAPSSSACARFNALANPPSGKVACLERR